MTSFLDRMKDLLKPYMKGTEPLEIRRGILEEVGSRVVSAGAGKRLFPYNRVKIHLLAAGPQEREELDAIVHDAWDLRRDVTDRLTDLGAKAPPDLDVEVIITDQPSESFGERRFHLEYQRAEGAAAGSTRSARPLLELTILKGTATQRVYTFTSPDRVMIGRLQEVMDEHERLKRRNDVAFHEEGDINETVSREQARIVWDETAREYRLRREPGASATRILRDGRSIEVSGQDRRGVRLQAGDEIYLGKACVKVGMREGG